MNKLMNWLYAIGLNIASSGLAASVLLGILIKLMEKNPWAFRLRLGWDVNDFVGYLYFAICLTIAGVVLFVMGLIRNKSVNSISATENLTNRNYCYHCQINVSPDTHVCPICSNELKEK